ncbi:MAG: hypothetical protein KKG59_02505 [Nanoarchaeota archaeon]|nr:hypothetical protein [Nanoarchaeota archaeon]MBU1975254.1 hypothetical protein [Nanoarchaeota archaeon]
MVDEQQLLEVVIDAAANAGEYLTQNAFTLANVEWKDSDNPVTYLDRQAEIMIRNALESRLEYSINLVGEEQPDTVNGAIITGYIDPIDGTKSYLSKTFRSTVSIGVSERTDHQEKLIMGVVYDFMRDIMYVGHRDTGFIRFRGEQHSFPQRLEGPPKISVGDKSIYHVQKKVSEIPDQIKITKPDGSIALGLVGVVNGNYDAMVAHSAKGNSWDVAGGICILESQGINVTDKYGRPIDLQRPNKGLIAIRPEYEEIIRPLVELPNPERML